MIEQLQIQPYALPLNRPWRSARGGFERRQGWLLQISAGGIRGYGDCAPLPAAGTETAEAARDVLHRIQSRFVGRADDTWLTELEGILATLPATRFGLECALGDLTSRRLGLPLRRWLMSGAPDQVPVNALLGPLGSLTPQDVQAAIAAGFRVLKIKVGLADPDLDLAQLTALAHHLPPGIGLRLDANGAWNLSQASRLIEGLAGLPIESIEEPLNRADPDQLARLQANAPFPLALDESLAGCLASFDPATLGVRRIVLKPALIGGLERTLELATRAMAAGVEVVITSLVESAAGLWPTAQLAAACGSPIPHGLATAEWLAEDLGPPPRPQLGRLILPATAGTGFSPAP